MAVLALILAVLALAAFVLVARPPAAPVRWSPLGVGLVLLTAAWIAQTVIVGGWHWTIR